MCWIMDEQSLGWRHGEVCAVSVEPLCMARPRKGKRAAEVSVDAKKVCSRCNVNLPASKFAKARMGAYGVTSICKDCRISDCADDNAVIRLASRDLARIEKINSLLVMGPAKSTTCVEDDAISTLINIAPSAGVEVRKWHDGTRSDIGVRPANVSEDAWYPVQIKSTRAVIPKFQWNCGDKPYNIPLLLMTGTREQAFLLRPDELTRHNEKLKSNPLIAYGVSAGYWRGALTPNKVFDILAELGTRWHCEHALGNGGLLATESTLQMQCSVDSQREWFVSSLSRMFSSATIHTRPSHQSTVDRFEDGVRIQDKSAAWMPREDTPYFKGKCAKLLRGVEIPYAVGDADLYCFAVVLEQERLFLEWRIPASAMDASLGRLSHIENDQVVKLGRTCINLPIVGPSDENVALHRRVFGRMPRKDTDLRPALFLQIHSIPSSVVLAECVCGRDPVPRH